MIFFAKLENGTISPHKRRQIADFIKRLSAKCDAVSIRVEPYKDTASNRQKRYYFGVIIPLIQAYFMNMGSPHSAEEIHFSLKEDVAKLTRYITKFNGDVVLVVKSLSELSTQEAEDYFEIVRVWAAEQGIYIPLPNE
jgi:hypothetical protein